MNPGTLLIRADAGIAIGTGHVMRCLALAQAWQDAGGKTLMAMAEATPAIEERLQRENVELAHLDANPGSAEDATGAASLARERHASWVAVDGYRFDSVYQNSLKSSGLRLLVIDDNSDDSADDDLHTERYSADLVLNQNAHATEHLYRGRAPQARLLLGPRYAMLRRAFGLWRDWRREIPPLGHRILVTMGGSDPDNFTSRAIEALRLVEGEGLDVVVVAGGSNPHLAALEAAVGKIRHPARLVTNVDNMPELMTWADMAISGAGTTCWEMCFMGLPALIVDLAQNQFPVARRLDELGVARHIGSSRDCPPDRIARELKGLLTATDVRRQMSDGGRALVDGKGASRVCAAMMEATKMESIVRVRRATESDSRLLWEWANEPGVRAASFSQRPIGWEEHRQWFQARLADAKCIILIGEDAGGRSVGQVRFDQPLDGEAEIDVSVAPDFRGAGYGSLLIDTAIREVFVSTGITKVNAFIRPENVSSIRAFEKAGFQRIGEKIVKGNPALHYCRQREQQR